MTTCGGICPEIIDVIASEKAKVIRKVEGLRFIPNSKIASASMVGGFRYFMSWLKKRARAYTRHAQSIGMETPRGSVIIGPPGTGKTFVAKIAAKVLGLDLVMLDIGSILVP
jgi:ATP-dependent 26S proteasome regulatory subunit